MQRQNRRNGQQRTTYGFAGLNQLFQNQLEAEQAESSAPAGANDAASESASPSAQRADAGRAVNAPVVHNVYRNWAGNLGFLYKRVLFSKKINGRLTENAAADENVRNRILGAQWDCSYYNALSFEKPQSNAYFKLKLLYPGLYVGMGYSQGVSEKSDDRKEDLKNGMSFDYTTGLPYIPGSEIKGMLRSSFINHPEDTLAALKAVLKDALKSKTGITEIEKRKSETEIENLNEADLLALERVIFGNRIKRKPADQNPDEQGGVIFYDAFPIQGSMGMDSITSHHKKKGNKDSIPPELQEPNPIKTLKVAAGSVFEFRFAIPDELKFGEYSIRRVRVKELFLQLILDWGMGAKTKLGYGTFCISE